MPDDRVTPDGFTNAQAMHDNAEPPEVSEPDEPEPTTDTAYLEIRVWTGDIARETLNTEEWMTAEFRREVEIKVAAFVADLFHEDPPQAGAEAAWYENAWPCQHRRHGVACGEPTTRVLKRFSAFLSERGVYRVCGYAKHEVRVGPLPQGVPA